MAYRIELEGFEGQVIEVKPSGFFSGPKLLVNGRPASKGPKRGQMILRRNDGTEVIAKWVPGMLGLDMPKLEVDGKVISVVEPLRWYEWVWSALPIGLLFVGGALGAAAGFIGFTINTRIFRSGMHPMLRAYPKTPAARKVIQAQAK